MNKKNNSLFLVRKTVDEEFGEIVTRHESWIRIYILFTIFLIFSFSFLIIEGEYSEKAHVNGYLIPDKGVIKVISNHQGLISKVNVIEGEHIKKGDLIFIIDVNAITNQGKASDLIADNIKVRRELLCKELERLNEIHKTQAVNIDNSIESFKNQKNALQKEIESENRYISLSSKNVSRYKELGKKYFVSTSDIEKAEQDLQSAIMQLNSLQRVLSSTEGNLEQQIEVKNSLRDKQQNEKSQLQREIDEIDQQLISTSQQQYLNILASSDGIITQITAKEGLEADAAIPLATILPDNSELEANIYVPSSSVGFIRNNTDVLLAYQAYPYQKFGLQHANIIEISKTAVNTKELPFDTHSADPLYLIKAKLDKPTITAYGKEEFLQSGEKFDAYLVLEHRKIWEWAIAPLLAEKSKI